MRLDSIRKTALWSHMVREHNWIGLSPVTKYGCDPPSEWSMRQPPGNRSGKARKHWLHRVKAE